MNFSIASEHTIPLVQLTRDAELRHVTDTMHEHHQCGEFAYLGGFEVERAVEHVANYMVVGAISRIHEFERQSQRVAAHFASAGGAGKTCSRKRVVAHRRRGAVPEI